MQFAILRDLNHYASVKKKIQLSSHLNHVRWILLMPNIFGKLIPVKL